MYPIRLLLRVSSRKENCEHVTKRGEVTLIPLPDDGLACVCVSVLCGFVIPFLPVRLAIKSLFSIPTVLYSPLLSPVGINVDLTSGVIKSHNSWLRAKSQTSGNIMNSEYKEGTHYSLHGTIARPGGSIKREDMITHGSAKN